MKVAVDKMRRYQRWTLRLLEVGLFGFHFSAMSFCWIELKRWVVIVITTGLLGASAFGTYYFMEETKRNFLIPKGKVVQGTFEQDRLIRGLRDHTYHQEYMDDEALQEKFGERPRRKPTAGYGYGTAASVDSDDDRGV